MHARARVVMKAVLLIAISIAAMVGSTAIHAAPKPVKAKPAATSDLASRTEKTLSAIPVRGSWRHIVIHHTATRNSSPCQEG